MATEIGSGKAYTTIQAAENALNTGTLSAPLLFECYDPADSGAVTIDGGTTSAANYIEIYAHSTYRHAGTYDAAKAKISAAVNGSLLIIQDLHVRVTAMQINNTYGRASAPVGIDINPGAGGDVRISECIMVAGGTGTASEDAIGLLLRAGAYTCTIKNCLVYDWGRGMYLSTTDAITLSLYNNTWVDNLTVGIYYAIDAGGDPAATVITKNNLVYYTGTAYTCYGLNDWGGSFTHENDLSRDATSPDTNHRSKTVVFVDGGANNFHLDATDVNAKDLGTDLSGTFTGDIDGVTRTGTWDIGADEITGAADLTISMSECVGSSGQLA